MGRVLPLGFYLVRDFEVFPCRHCHALVHQGRSMFGKRVLRSVRKMVGRGKQLIFSSSPRLGHRCCYPKLAHQRKAAIGNRAKMEMFCPDCKANSYWHPLQLMKRGRAKCPNCGSLFLEPTKVSQAAMEYQQGQAEMRGPVKGIIGKRRGA